MLLPGGESLTRDELIGRLQEARDQRNEWLRRQILDNQRLDILAEVVLGYDLQPFHVEMLRFTLKHPHSLQLAFRGAGKSTSVEIVKIIWDILKDRNVRILITSKTAGFATAILREVKQHFEENATLREIFGDLVSEDKWDVGEIQVKGRNKPMKESTVTTVGLGGQLIGLHFDKVYGDDIVDEDNSRTPNGRQTTKTWYYKVLMPTLEPTAELHIFGTRYHFSDHYGHLQANEMREHTQIIPALDAHERSPWPSKWSAAYFKKLREQLGIVIFNSQYQCDTEAMKGEVFDIDWMGEPINLEDVPTDVACYAGIDLAIGQESAHDLFAMVGIGVKGPDIYVMALMSGHLTFGEQTRRIIQWWETGWNGVVDPARLVKFGIEINAYQAAQYQNVREQCADIVLDPITTLKDKLVRAHRLAARFQEGRIHICKSVWNTLVDHLLQFPGGRYKDVFDALDLAVTTAYRKGRARRSEEVGLL